MNEMNESRIPQTAHEARLRADAHRARATARRIIIQRRVQQEFTIGSRRVHNSTPEEILELWLSRDALWKSNVSDNQWWLQQTIAYGVDETVALLRRINGQNDQIIALLKEIRDDHRAATADDATN